MPAGKQLSVVSISCVQYSLARCIELFNDGGPYHIEISPWTGFCMIRTTVMKQFRQNFWYSEDVNKNNLIVCSASVKCISHILLSSPEADLGLLQHPRWSAL